VTGTSANGSTLAVDIGGTHCRVASVAGDGRILASVICDTPRDGEPEALAESLWSAADRLQSGAPAGPAGVALPGLWDRATGVMERAVNVPLLEGRDLRSYFATVLRRPVFVETDVIAAAWAQWQALTPRPARFLYLSLGTGVGGCVILDGQIVRHTHEGAGHFGFLIVDTAPDAPAGRNGVPGCLSAAVSGQALEQAGSRMPPRAAEGLAVGLHQLTHIYAPDVIALGGGVIDNHPKLVTEARQAFERRRTGLVPNGMQIVDAPLDSHDAGVIGVAALARAAGG